MNYFFLKSDNCRSADWHWQGCYIISNTGSCRKQSVPYEQILF